MKNHIQINIIAAFLLTFAIMSLPQKTSAASGACSWHGGVNCSRGMQSSGKVYCNDGWTESATYYEYTAKCQDGTTNQGSLIDIVWKQLYYDGKIVPSTLDIDYDTYKTTEKCPANSKKENDFINNTTYCVCNEGYYNYKANDLAASNQLCEQGEPFVHMVILAQKASNAIIDSDNRTNSQCRLRYGDSFLNEKGDCACKTGYRWVYDVYNKVIFCIKRDDYENVIKNSTPDPLENVVSADKVEGVDYTAYGNIPENEENTSDNINTDPPENPLKKLEEERQKTPSISKTEKKPDMPSSTRNNAVAATNTTNTDNGVVKGIIIVSTGGYLYHKIKKKRSSRTK